MSKVRKTRPAMSLEDLSEARAADPAHAAALDRVLAKVIRGNASGQELRMLPIDLIERSRFQPRESFDAEMLAGLAESIRHGGVISPILVRPTGPDRHELVAGERRWRAAQMAGLDRIPAIVSTLSDEMAAEVALIENLQREDLNPIEIATGLERLRKEFGHTQESLASIVGIDRATVSRLLGLLSLPSSILNLIRSRALSVGQARVLLGLSPALQEQLANEAATKSLTVRAMERLKARLERPPAPRAAPRKDPDTRRLEDLLSEHAGFTVNIQQRKTGGAVRLVVELPDNGAINTFLERLRSFRLEEL